MSIRLWQNVVISPQSMNTERHSWFMWRKALKAITIMHCILMCYSFINPITRHLSVASLSLPPVLNGCSPWCWICPPHVAVAPRLHSAARETTKSLLAGRHSPESHSRGLIKPHATVHIPCFDRHAFEVHYCVCHNVYCEHQSDACAWLIWCTFQT